MPSIPVSSSFSFLLAACTFVACASSDSGGGEAITPGFVGDRGGSSSAAGGVSAGGDSGAAGHGGTSGHTDAGGQGGAGGAHAGSGGAHAGAGALGGSSGSSASGGAATGTGGANGGAAGTAAGLGGGGATGGAAGSGGATATCPCTLDGFDNYCFYDVNAPENAGCPMLKSGTGYCNPDGDGDPHTGATNWTQGYSDFQSQCHPACGDGHCSAPSECASCAADCAGKTVCAPPDACGDGTCDPAKETCQSCPKDCGACPTCTPGTLACSKLGAQSMGDGAPFTDFLSACPRVAKWVAVGGVPWDQIQKYKCQCPGGLSVLRMYGPAMTFATAQDMWTARYASLDAATPEQKAAVDYVESDNECDAGHCWFTPGDPSYSPSSAASADYGAFLSGFVTVAQSKGWKPLVGNLGVGGVGGDVETCDGAGSQAFSQLVPAIMAAGAAGGGWAYHAYTPTWSQEIGDNPVSGFESYYALRYRRFVGCFPALTSVPLVLTEGGFDKGGNPDADGYRTNGGLAPYSDWLTWFGGELGKDSFVKGVALFAFAPAGQWSSFRLDDDVAAIKALAVSCK